MPAHKVTETGRHQLYTALTSLSEADEALLADTETTLATADTDTVLRFSTEKLADVTLYPPGRLIKLCSRSDALKYLCEQDNYPHVAAWQQHLKQHHYPCENFVSYDKKTVCTIFDQYLASHLYNAYLKLSAHNSSNKSILLELACQLNLFPAFVERSKINANKLMSASTTSEEKQTAMAELDRDAKQLGHLYWTVGCLHASILYLDIGLYYATHQQEAAADEKIFQAATYFLRAKELNAYKNCPENTLAINAICKENGLDIFGYNGWERADAFYFQYLNPDRHSESELRSKVKAEIHATLDTLSQTTQRSAVWAAKPPSQKKKH